LIRSASFFAGFAFSAIFGLELESEEELDLRICFFFFFFLPSAFSVFESFAYEIKFLSSA